MSLTVILGPMFSKKTTTLIQHLLYYEQNGKLAIAIDHEINSRYNSISELGIVTHDHISYNNILRTRNLSSLIPSLIKYDVIAIDEGQFFIGILDFCRYMLTLGKIIIVAGLDLDYRKEPFGEMLELVSIADTVHKHLAKCYNCELDAPYTMRTSDETAIIQIGNNDIYRPVCKQCYNIN